MVDFDLIFEGKELFRSEFPDVSGSWRLDWRLLTLKEYRVFSILRASNTLHPFYIYKKVFDKCYIGDSNLLSNHMPLFIPMTIGSLIMYLSGDSNPDTIQNEIAIARTSYDVDDIFELMKRAICVAFPNQDWDQLENLTKHELISKFTIAESLLVYKTSGGYQPIDLSKLTRRDAQVQESQNIEFVDFDSENAELVRSLDPFELENSGFSNKINTEQARKLDKLSRQSR